MEKTICRYVFAKYYPHPLRDEAVNIGVIGQAPSRGQIKCQFLTSYAKVKSFDPNVDTRMLQDFAAFWNNSLGSSALFAESESETHFGGLSTKSSDFLDYISSQYEGVLQFSEPRASYVADFDEEIRSLYDNYVKPTVSSQPKIISSTQLSPKVMRDRLYAQFFKRGLIKEDWVIADYPVQGTEYPLTFDLGFKNGHVRVLQSLALDDPNPDVKVNRAFLLKARVGDARDVDPTFEAEAIVKAPTKNDAGYRESRKILEKAEIKVYTVAELPTVVHAIEQNLIHHHEEQNQKRYTLRADSSISN